MEQRTDDGFSPYLTLSRGEWAALREDTPMTLTADEVTRVRSLHDRLDMKEVEEIYLPISRLLSLYVAATQRLFIVQQHFLGTAEAKVPYIIGVAGSVAVGKSTTARVLQALLARWPNTPKVDLVTTDGFLLPNAVLEREGLMEKKGFPESYDLPALLRFLADVKAGRRPVRAPIYSHLVYDVVPNQWVEVDRPDILIVEGLNVLQAGTLPKDGKAIPYVSDFFDFSVYIDAEEDVLRNWYVDRFLTLRETAFRDPKSYFHRYSSLNDKEAIETATSIWERINLINLRENILPTRQRAHLILKKEASHLVQEVSLRKLDLILGATHRLEGAGALTLRDASFGPLLRLRERAASLEDLREPVAIERLHQKIVHAGRKAGVAVLAEGIGGERNDARARQALCGFRGADAARRLQPVEFGHVHVHQNEIVGRAGVWSPQ